MKEVYYFDNAGTTKVTPAAQTAMEQMNSTDYFNPSALYSVRVKDIVEDCRRRIADVAGLESSRLYFTSCATESNNWALTCGLKNKKGNLVVSEGEHASVYESAMQLKSKGIEVRFVPLKEGAVDLDKLASAVDGNTGLISLIACSNETGAVNDVAAAARIRDRICPRALLHADAVQAFIKLPPFYKSADLISFSAHKVCGPKGIGALYIARSVNLSPFIFGGGQEGKQRSGTENTAGIAGFAAAAEFYHAWDKSAIPSYRRMIREALTGLEDVKINESPENSPFILSASVGGIKGEILQHMLWEKGFVIGLGSACAAKSRQNRVLAAMGLKGADVEGSIRISFGPDNDEAQCLALSEALSENIKILRSKING